MASNEYVIADHYEDLTPAANVDQKTLNKMAWRSCFLQASFNYERMQAAGWLYAMLPGLEKVHTNKKDLATSMSHNLEFFNIHPFLVTFAQGIILSMEQNKVDIPTIRAVRVSLMGPLGGIGDALFWMTLVPILAGITSQMAISGNAAGPIIFLLVFNIIQFALRFWLMNMSYKFGTGAIDMLTANMKDFTRAASIMGVFVVGCLTVTMGNVTTKLEIPNGTTNVAVPVTTVVEESELASYDQYLYAEDGKLLDGAAVVDLGNGYSEITFNRFEEQPVTINIQKILDSICPKLLPVAIVMLMYWLLSKKNFTPIKCIVVVLLLGILGSGCGIWPALW